VIADTSVLIVIPAYNEAGSVGQVVAEVHEAAPKVHVLVVDDASRDATAARARAAGADVVVNPINLGVGGAMRVGFRYARANGYRAVVQVDGDGQHDSTYLETILDDLEDDDVARVVIGARFAGVGAYPVAPARRAAMWVLSTYLSRATGVGLTDVTSGFRASNREAIELFATSYPTAYLADTVESLALVAHHGGRVSQVPVAMRSRISGSPSQSNLKAALHLARVATRLPFAGRSRQPVIDLQDRVRRLAEDLALVANEVESLRPPEEHRQ
jgi:glycosyltransferase involved in cell wall biosynthesis